MILDKRHIVALLMMLMVRAITVHAQGDEPSPVLSAEVRNLFQPSAIFLTHAYDLADENAPPWDIFRVVQDVRFRNELRRLFKEVGSAGAGEQFTDWKHGLFQVAQSYDKSPSLAAFGPASYSYVMANRGFRTDAEGTPATLASAIRKWAVANTAIVERNLKTVMKGLSEIVEGDRERAEERIIDALTARQAKLSRASQQMETFLKKYLRLKTEFEKTLYEWTETSPAALGVAIHPLLIQALSDSKPRPARSAAEKERARRIDTAIAFIQRNGIRFDETSATGGNTSGPGVVTSGAGSSAASSNTGYHQQLSRTAHLYLASWGDLLADTLGVETADTRKAMGPLHRFNLGLAARIVAFRDKFLAEIQDESGQPILEINEISWMADDEKAEEDFCRSLYPKEGETRVDRALYKDWIKKLICDYIKADFSKKADRTRYVEQVLAALRKNNSGTGWKIKTKQTVSHIVTQDPVALIWIPGKSEPKGQVIGTAGIQRSRFEPETAATGFHQSLFVVPEAKSVAEAEVRIPNAEQLIQYVFMFKVAADLIADNAGTLSAPQVNEKLKEQQRAFIAELLKVAKAATLQGAAIQAKPDVDVEPAPNIDAAHNLKRYDPSDGNIRITKIQEGDMLGLTEAQRGISSRVGLTSGQLQLEKLESVLEKAMAQESKQHIVGVAIRTLFVSRVFYGAVRGEKVLQVISRGGTSCTEKIKAHEDRHVTDQWQAWKKSVINAITTNLKAQTFPDGRAYSLTRVVEPIEDPGETLAALKIQFAALFPSDKKKAADDAKVRLSKAYGETELAAFKQHFDNEREKQAEAFHEIQYALDDDCKFVGKGKPGKILGAAGSADIPPGSPKIDPSELRPK